MMVNVKRCSKCKKWKDKSAFDKDRSGKDGLAVWCKECTNKAARESYERRLAVRTI